MDIKSLSAPLPISAVEFRVQSINNGGYATLLAYKNARVDMQRLDDAVGPLMWKRRHCMNNHNCVVSIYDAETAQWIDKEDTGSESSAEAAKGLASDSFKRACTNWGIGRELYNYPNISILLNDDEWSKETKKATWKLQIKHWIWYAEHDENGEVSFLAGKDNNGQVRFKWGEQAPKEA